MFPPLTCAQYRSAIFTHSEVQQREARESLEAEEKRIGKRIATEITAAPTFYAAEAYHQKYLEKGGQCSRKG